MGVSSAVIGFGAHVARVAMVDNASRIYKSCIKSFINGIFVVQTNPTLPTLNHTAAMLKISGQSDPDRQRYFRHTHTHRQRLLVFIEIFVFYTHWYRISAMYRPILKAQVSESVKGRKKWYH